MFEDGLPRKRDYRSFIIRTEGADDTAAVAEVVTRRFQSREPEPEDDGRRFAYPPALLVIDGGAPQVRAAQDALMSVGMGDLPVVGLAKRLEEVWLPDEADPVILPRTSEALYLLQRVRDEAHRTAIALHRKRRGQAGDRQHARRRPGPRPGEVEGTAASLRVGARGPRGERDGAGRRTRDRPGPRAVDPRHPRCRLACQRRR